MYYVRRAGLVSASSERRKQRILRGLGSSSAVSTQHLLALRKQKPVVVIELGAMELNRLPVLEPPAND